MFNNWSVVKRELRNILPILLVIVLAWLLGLGIGTVALIIAILAWLRAGDLRTVIGPSRRGD